MLLECYLLPLIKQPEEMDQCNNNMADLKIETGLQQLVYRIRR